MNKLISGNFFLLTGILMGHVLVPGVLIADDNCVTDNRTPPWREKDLGFRPRQQDEIGYRDRRPYRDYEGFRPRPGDEAEEWRSRPDSKCKPRQYDAFKDRGFRPRDGYGGRKQYDTGSYREPGRRTKSGSWSDKGRTSRDSSLRGQYVPGAPWPDHLGGRPAYPPPAYPGYYGYPDDYSSNTWSWPFSTNMWEWMPIW